MLIGDPCQPRVKIGALHLETPAGQTNPGTKPCNEIITIIIDVYSFDCCSESRNFVHWLSSNN